MILILGLLLGHSPSKEILPRFYVGFLLLLAIAPKINAQVNTVDFFKKPFSVEYEKSIAKEINAGIGTFLTQYTSKVTAKREKFWNRRFASVDAYNVSVDPNRKDLRKMIGITDTVSNVKLKTLGDPDKGNIVAKTTNSTIYEVEWTVTPGLKSRGLLLEPKGKIKASAVVIPDADETPEAYSGLKAGPEVALRLAENGIRVLVPGLVNRGTQYSGSDKLMPKNPWMGKADSVSTWTNETHREWIWRQGFIMGKHIIGIEVQKVLAAVNWLKKNTSESSGKVGVMGYEEGGLLAFYAASIDKRIDVAWVSGYFGPREQLWNEPVYRDIWGLLTEFGDAEIASMIAPRSLVIEAAPVPAVKEPLPPKKGQQNSALPGVLKNYSENKIKKEVTRLKNFFPPGRSVRADVTLLNDVKEHGTIEALKVFTNRLGVHVESFSRISSGSITTYNTFDPQKRQYHIFENMEHYIQNMIPTAARRRYAFLKGDYSSPKAWNKSMQSYRKRFYTNMVGKIHEELLPINPKVRQIYDKPDWKGYEVALEVWPDVYSWGILAVPKSLKPNEKRPAVVMQHGQYGLPTTSILAKNYHRVLPRLVKKGFVVFAPYNAYEFRGIRKAHAVKANLFSVIIPQYQQILNFLKSREYVDGSRIGLYGKSWGGRTAMRVPIVLDDFKVAISVAYFNDWLNKAASIQYANSYNFSNSIGIYNWNMGNTFTHAEMAQLIAPRPFMEVDGYLDAVATAEMVAGEFAKVKRIYDMMGIGDRAQLDIWKGEHEIDNIHWSGIHFLIKHLSLFKSKKNKKPKRFN